MAAVAPFVPLITGVAAVGASTHLVLEQRRAAQRAERAQREAADALASAFAEVEAPPPPPPPPPLPAAPELPAPAAPVPGAQEAAERAQQEAAATSRRRRTISLFRTSRQEEGRRSTILTGSSGAQGTPTVRRRTLGSPSILGG